MRPARIRDFKMKRIVFCYLVIASLAVPAAFTSCGGGGISGSSYKIKMTTEQGGEFIFVLDGSGTATVDWGDGSEKNSLTLPASFQHTYPSATIRTITVNGDNITGLRSVTGCNITSLDVSKNTELTSLDVGCWGGCITSLDLSKNTALTILQCYGHPLTSLDLSKNTSLTYLCIGDNRLTGSMLNSLFTTLHSNSIPPLREEGTPKFIYINSRPQGDFDKSIAERKGWTFHVVS